MPQQILIDTDILIDVARSIDQASDRLNAEAQNATLVISVVTQNGIAGRLPQRDRTAKSATIS